MSHVTQTIESCPSSHTQHAALMCYTHTHTHIHTYTYTTNTHMHTCTHTHVTHTAPTRHSCRYAWVMSHAWWMSHVTHVNESCHTIDSIMSLVLHFDSSYTLIHVTRLRFNHVTRPCHRFNHVTRHWFNHVTRPTLVFDSIVPTSIMSLVLLQSCHLSSSSIQSCHLSYIDSIISLVLHAARSTSEHHSCRHRTHSYV